MITTVTSRRFKAHKSLTDYAEDAVKKLSHFYDGIIKCEVILSFERPRNSLKIAEIVVSVYRSRLAALEKSDAFEKSIDGAIIKVLAQLKKYKDKLHAKDRKQVRQVREKA